MKFEIWEDSKCIELVVTLRLNRLADGSIVLCAVDDKGILRPAGTLLKINSCGVELFEDFNRSIGLPLDSKGRVKLIE